MYDAHLLYPACLREGLLDDMLYPACLFFLLHVILGACLKN
jgi:hypothetical protein